MLYQVFELGFVMEAHYHVVDIQRSVIRHMLSERSVILEKRTRLSNLHVKAVLPTLYTDFLKYFAVTIIALKREI